MSLDAKNRITIDVAGSVYTPVVRAVQEDIRSRFVEIVLIANGEPLEIPDGTHGIIGIRRPNGTHVLYDATEDETDAVTFDGNVATAYLSQQALAEPGDLYVSVSLYANSARLTAFHFIVRVDATAVPSGVVIDSDYFNILEAMIDQAVDAANRAEQAAATVGNPVGYDPQTPTAAEQAQARANIGIGNASTSAAGIVQLYDGIDSTSTTMAATAAAVKLAAESGAIPVMVETSGVSSLPITLYDSDITADMVLLRAELSSPRSQTSAWEIATAAGSVTISGSINGTTDIKLILSEVKV